VEGVSTLHMIVILALSKVRIRDSRRISRLCGLVENRELA
jgi:hypothetical protein